MLGVLFFSSQFGFAAEDFATHRRAMQQLLGSLGLRSPMPRSHAAFKERYTTTFSRLTKYLYTYALPVLDFFNLGVCFASAALSEPAGEEGDQFYRQLAGTLLARYGFDPNLVRERIGSISSGSTHERGIHVGDVMTATLALFRALVEPLPEEPRTCFVAMPFSSRFQMNFAKMYQPLLENQGYRVFRAWGSVANEDFVQLMLALIDKSGALLADVTGQNPNVTYETGYAHGRRKSTFLLADVSNTVNPANLSAIATMGYRRRAGDWRSEFVTGLGHLYIRECISVHERDGSYLRKLDTFEREIENTVRADLYEQLAMGRADLAIEKEPEKPGPLQRRADLRQKAGDHAGAASDYLAALERGADPRDVLLPVAFSLNEIGEFGRAAETLDRCVELGISNDAVMLLRGTARYNLHDYAGSERDLSALPNLAPWVRMLRSLCRFCRGDYEGARADLDKAQQEGVDNEEIHQNRAVCLVRLGLLSDAQRDCEEADRRASIAPFTHGCWAELHLGRGEFQGALDHFSAALRASGDLGWNFKIGLAHLLLGQSEKAVAAVSEGLGSSKRNAVMGIESWDRDLEVRSFEFWTDQYPDLASIEAHRALRAIRQLLKGPHAESVGATARSLKLRFPQGQE